jgi:hypothetical protein
MNNREMFESMISAGSIALRRGTLFDSTAKPLPVELDWDRIEGMMLRLAIGDSLGNTSEGMLPDDRRKRFSVVKDYLPNGHVNTSPGEARKGYPSDDTQLAFWTLDKIQAVDLMLFSILANL